MRGKALQRNILSSEAFSTENNVGVPRSVPRAVDTPGRSQSAPERLDFLQQ